MDARIVALSKVVKDKAYAAARDGLAVGSHTVDCTVHITGAIKVGEDSESDVRGTVNYKDAFATVCGVLKEACESRGKPLPDALLGELIAMAMRQSPVAKGLAETIAETVAAVERDCTKVTGKKPKRGSVTTKLDYEVFENPNTLRLTGTES